MLKIVKKSAELQLEARKSHTHTVKHTVTQTLIGAVCRVENRGFYAKEQSGFSKEYEGAGGGVLNHKYFKPLCVLVALVSLRFSSVCMWKTLDFNSSAPVHWSRESLIQATLN